MDELSALRRAHAGEVTTLTQASSSAEHGRQDAERARAAVTAQLDATYGELEVSASEVAALRERVASLAIEREEALEASSRMGDDFAQALGNVAELRVSLAAAGSDVLRVSTERDDLDRRLEVLGASERVLREESAGLRRELGQVAARGAAVDEIARLRAELQQLGSAGGFGGLVIVRR